MKLSTRQQDVLNRLLDLYRRSEAPVHYTEVADALNVSPVTAYDMLRRLEEKGMVEAETIRPVGHKGRSLIAFSPTPRARSLIDDLTDGALSERTWEQAKADLINALEQAEGTDYADLLETLLLRIPERKSPLLFAADTVTAIILTFYNLRDTAAARGIFTRLRRFGPPGWAMLYSLAGLSLGLSLIERANRRATTRLLSYGQEFQEHLDHLTVGDKNRLSDFVYEVLRTLGF